MNAGPASQQATIPSADQIERLLPHEVAEQRLTFGDVLERRRGDQHPGLLFEDEQYSWAEVVDQCELRAKAMYRLRREDRAFHVGVLLENVPDYIFLLGGAAMAGATIVGINPTRRGAELAADIRSVDCDLIITDDPQLHLLSGLDTGVEEGRIFSIDSAAWQQELEAAAATELPYIEAAHEPSTQVLLTFTSGSTGAPKAVICSTGRLASLSAINHLSFTRSDVTYNSMPLFHGNAIFSCWGPSVFTGATFSMRRKFSAS
ncbi:MAG: AMP-binding protein, partial [Dietzia sp.]